MYYILGDSVAHSSIIT